MIPGLDNFVKAYKEVAAGHRDLYENNVSILRKWTPLDFRNDSLFTELNKTDRNLLYSVVKKAYDMVKCHHRSYVIYTKTRGDYYRSAVIDRDKDAKLLDVAANNLHRLYDDMQSKLDKEE